MNLKPTALQNQSHSMSLKKTALKTQNLLKSLKKMSVKRNLGSLKTTGMMSLMKKVKVHPLHLLLHGGLKAHLKILFKLTGNCILRMPGKKMKLVCFLSFNTVLQMTICFQ